MYDVYYKAYQHHRVKYGADTAIFYQVGKFYEMYDFIGTTGDTRTSMKRAVEILGIQMSLRDGDGPGGTTGLFAGIPEQSLHKYATLLTRQNWTVIVYDQVKDIKGAVKDRVVTRVLSPGTHVESAEGQAVWIAGVWLEEAPWTATASTRPPAFALMALDLTTGKSVTYEGSAVGKSDSWTADGACHFFQVHQPKECIVWWSGDSVTCPSPEMIRRQFGLLGAIRIERGSAQAQGSLEIALVRQEFLARVFSIRSLLSPTQAIQITAPRTERILCALLQRIEEMFPSGVQGLTPPSRWNPDSSLFLGNQALLQLNMITPRMEDSILGLFQRTYTTFGLRAIRQRILYPIADREKLERSYAEVQTVLDWPEGQENPFQTNLRQIADLPRLHRKITACSPSPADILLLDQSYTCVERLQIACKGTTLEWTKPSTDLLKRNFHSVFSVEKARTASVDSFCIQDSRAPAVAAIEERIRSLRGQMVGCLETISNWASIPLKGAQSLRLEERELSGPILTGTKSAFGLISARMKKDTAGNVQPPFPGILVNQKKSSAHLEVPFLDSIYREILKARFELQDMLRAVLPSLCDELSRNSMEFWNSMEEWVAHIDVTCTIARVSKDMGFSRPVLKATTATATSEIHIEGLRHPLIEASVTRTEYVKHSVDLDSSCRGWLVYGMNASGKSSLMKAVGIAIILAQAGCYVPCKSLQYVPFKSLFTRILNTDNLWAGLSSFAVEMTELREILEHAGENSLVLGDELCSGTESISATAIVGAGLQWLHSKGAKFIFATHLHGLSDIPSVQSLPHMKTWHLKVRYDPVTDRLIYERTLTPGPGSSLYGLEVARAMNLPEEVLQMALTIRRGLLGTVNEMEAPSSQWNTGIHRQKCEVCGCGIVKELEVHHIRERKDAIGKRFSDGSAQDHVRNLIVVCTKCHDAHHAGNIEIAPIVQTSDGPIRPTVAVEPVESVKSESHHRSSKWSDEQIQCIKDYVEKFPNSPPKRAVFDLKEMGIAISASSLRGFRN